MSQNNTNQAYINNKMQYEHLQGVIDELKNPTHWIRYDNVEECAKYLYDRENEYSDLYSAVWSYKKGTTVTYYINKVELVQSFILNDYDASVSELERVLAKCLEDNVVFDWI